MRRARGAGAYNPQGVRVQTSANSNANTAGQFMSGSRVTSPQGSRVTSPRGSPTRTRSSGSRNTISPNVAREFAAYLAARNAGNRSHMSGTQSMGGIRSPMGNRNTVARKMLMGSLSPRLNNNQMRFARVIIDGQLDMILESGVPKSYYNVAFDTDGNKLVAFAAKVAVKQGTTHDHGVHKAIFEYIVEHAPKVSDLTTCAKDRLGHCLAHAIAQHATQTSQINVIKSIINAKVGAGTFAKHAGKANKNGRRAANYAGGNAIKEHYGKMTGISPNVLKTATPAELAAMASLLGKMRRTRI